MTHPVVRAALAAVAAVSLCGCIEKDYPPPSLPGIEAIPALTMAEGETVDLRSYVLGYIRGVRGQPLDLRLDGWPQGRDSVQAQVCLDRGVHDVEVRAKVGASWYGDAAFQVTVEPSPQDPPVLIDGKHGLYAVTAGTPMVHVAHCAVKDTECSVGLAFHVHGAPTGAVVYAGSGRAEGPAEMTMSWTPTAADRGEHRATFQCLGDGEDDGDVTVEVVNAPPAFTSSPPKAPPCPEAAWIYPVTVTDHEGDPVTLSVATGPAGLSEVTTGVFRWVPSASGDYPFVFAATDDHGGATTQAFVVSIEPGCVGSWQTAPAPLLTPRMLHASAVTSGVLVVAGGSTGAKGVLPQSAPWGASVYAYDALASVEATPLNPDGSPGGFVSAPPLSLPRLGHGLVASGGWVYALGGLFNDTTLPLGVTKAVERAPAGGGGLSGPWVADTPLATPRAYLGAAAWGGWIYAAGGTDNGWTTDAGVAGTTGMLSTVEAAPVRGDGSLGAWVTATPLPAPRWGFSLAAAGGFLYASGGSHSETPDTPPVPSADLLRAPIHDDGSLGAWATLIAASAWAWPGGSVPFPVGYAFPWSSVILGWDSGYRLWPDAPGGATELAGGASPKVRWNDSIALGTAALVQTGGASGPLGPPVGTVRWGAILP